MVYDCHTGRQLLCIHVAFWISAHVFFQKPLIQSCVDPVLFSNERRHSTIVQARISLGCWVTTNKFCGYCNDRAFTRIALAPVLPPFYIWMRFPVSILYLYMRIKEVKSMMLKLRVKKRAGDHKDSHFLIGIHALKHTTGQEQTHCKWLKF